MTSYLVIDGDWLEAEIRNAKVLSEHARSTGKAVAIAAAGVRLESLKEIRQRAARVREDEDGPVRLSLDALPD